MIDLHIHSTASDGTLTPEAIVARAQELGLRALALADHDSVAGTEPALAAAEGTDLIVIPAVEISTDWESTEIHLLGYFLDYHNPELLEMLGRIREAREGRAEQMVRRLRDIGIEISYEAVLERAGGGSVGRPHVAAELAERGLVRSPQEAFDKYLVRDKPAYVPRYKLSYLDAIGIIRRCQGLPVLSHPGLVHDETKVREMLAAVDGVEAYHTAHTPGQCARYAKLARERGLLITGGTDSHGPGGTLPVEIGSQPVANEVEALERLLTWARDHGRWS